MKKIILVVLVVALSFMVSQSYASTKADVSKAINLMRSSAGSEKLLSFTNYKDGSFQCVYVVDGKRYTAYYTPKPAGGWLSFWVRPDGTYGQKLIKTFTDHKFDGKVEFGIGGSKNEKLFDIDDRNVGREFQSYWQSMYDEAIADAIKQLEQSSE